MFYTADTLSHAMVLETSADKLIERLSNELDAANDKVSALADRWQRQFLQTCALFRQVADLTAERDMLATRAASQAREIARLMGELQKLQPAKPEPEVGGIGNAISVMQRGGVR